VFSHRLARRVVLGETQRERWDALLGLSLGKRSLGERSLGWDALPGDGLRGHEPRGDGQPGDRELLRFARSRALIQSAVAEFIGESGPDLVLDARCPSCYGPHGPLTLAVREGGETGAEREKVVAPSPSPGRRMLKFGSPYSAPTVPSASLSTSEDVIVVAVSDDARLGVDVEVLFSARHGVGSGDVAQRVRDVADVLGVDANDERAVLQRWVRVEAVLKADGRGLRVDPRDVRFVEDDADGHDDDHDDDHDHDDNDDSACLTTGAPRWRATVRDDADFVYRGMDLALASGVVGAVAHAAGLG
jgi:hypothetical protein